MNDILQPTIECKETSEDGSYGKYVVSPLERGYGTTLGNSLRRVLLSSLTGAAGGVLAWSLARVTASVLGLVSDLGSEDVIDCDGLSSYSS